MIGAMQFKKIKGINMNFKRFDSISEIKKGKRILWRQVRIIWNF